MPSGDLADSCRALVRTLGGAARDAPPHAGAAPATLEDHLLTTSALVACLAEGHPRRDLLRLAALSHDLPEGILDARLAADPQARRWMELLRRHGAALDQRTAPALPDDPDERLLALAHLAASARLPMRGKDDFATHPLAAAPLVDLVYGGATRIKQYVFESARLPEIRGASALLDHINRLDLPAFWGVTPKLARQRERYQEARDWLAATGAQPLDAPECVLYASGGNILALAPAGTGELLARAIERRYTEVTQVAASVAVWETVSLLELQYGRRPRDFWLDDLERMLMSPALRRLLVDSYGIGTDILRDEPAFQRWASGEGALAEADLAAFRAWVFGADSLPDQDAALLGEHQRRQVASRKGFGELVTLLAAKADRRRAGDGAETGAPRSTPFVDLISAARRCASCDVRPAAELAGERAFCAACAIKRDIGTRVKKGQELPDSVGYTWIYSWGAWLAQRLNKPNSVLATTNDLPEIGQAARGHASGFVGLIYADGNNVGSHIAGLSSIAGYRRFAQQMLEANEQAVARALRAHLAPDNDEVWPFEIITIGGDDVLLFVPADRALTIAAAIAEDFGRQMESARITLSAGVLIMADSTPVRFARDLVEELLKSAKQLSKNGAGAATIDFMALKAATMVSETIKEYRRAAFGRLIRRERGGTTRETHLRLTQRPYALDQFRALLDAGRELMAAHFPASQLHQLAEIVGAGQHLRAMVDYHYFVGRGRARERDGGSYARFERAIGALCGQEDTAPWRADEAAGDPRSRAYDTPLLDLVEILPFVGTASQEQTS
jgi:CRISPR-associated protein Cmr2